MFQDQGITLVSPAAGDGNLVSRNEEILLDARRSFYEEVKRKNKNAKKLKFGHYIGEKTSTTLQKQKYIFYLFFLGKTLLPSFILFFSSLYWGYGLGHYYGWIMALKL